MGRKTTPESEKRKTPLSEDFGNSKLLTAQIGDLVSHTRSILKLDDDIAAFAAISQYASYRVALGWEENLRKDGEYIKALEAKLRDEILKVDL